MKLAVGIFHRRFSIRFSNSVLYIKGKWISNRCYHIPLSIWGKFGTEDLHVMPLSNSEFLENHRSYSRFLQWGINVLSTVRVRLWSDLGEIQCMRYERNSVDRLRFLWKSVLGRPYFTYGHQLTYTEACTTKSSNCKAVIKTMFTSQGSSFPVLLTLWEVAFFKHLLLINFPNMNYFYAWKEVVLCWRSYSLFYP